MVKEIYFYLEETSSKEIIEIGSGIKNKMRRYMME